jgi:phosphatidate cytidylyltransferase
VRWALPAIAFAVFIVWQGGEVFALGLVLLGVIALGELYLLMGRVRPPALAGFVTLAALLAVALYGEPRHVIIVLVAAFPVTFFLALLRPRRENVSWAVAATMFGVVWIGLALVHAIWLRELEVTEANGETIVTGMGLVFDVLIATFVGDTLAYFVGRAYGRRRIAPLISPNKTFEGLVGGVVGATLAFWCAGLYQDWLTGEDALLIGFLVAIVAPVGDLFESMIKRDLEVKDTGRLFGPHGGVLDRLDAAFFTIVVGYYAAVGLGYG